MPNKRKELLEIRAAKRSSINKAKAERDALLLSLDKKIRFSKLKEEKIKKEMYSEKILEKTKEKELREKNSIKVDKQKQELSAKRETMKIKNSAFRKQMAATTANINAGRAMNKKLTSEKISGIRFARRADLEKRKLEVEKIKADSLEARYKIEEERTLELEKKRKINKKREEVLAAEKIEIAKEVVKLKNLRSEKRMLQAARRQEKIEKAKAERSEQENIKEEARLRYREEINSIKHNNISQKIETEKELKAEKEIFNHEEDILDEETSKVISETKLSLETLEYEKELAGEDLKIDYSFAFEEANVETEQKTEIIEANIQGSTIASFGKHGMKKYSTANKDAVESDINKYVKLPDLYDSITEFRKVMNENTPIEIRSFKAYLELLLDAEITEENFGVFQSHLVTALLTRRSIKFANGYIENLPVKGLNFVTFTRSLSDVNSLIALSDEKLEEESNKLALKKLNAGGSIRIAKGLIATMKDKEIVVLQDTNFTKA